jgi:UDP-N-acetylmuramoyl-L-alanyl-D-glutamate--2,6-diaminopimelate ligase
VVTNVTHEHLDEHGTFDAYLASKAKLFQLLETTVNKLQGNPRLAVLNHDDPSYKYLKKIIVGGTRSYGILPGANLRGEEVVSQSGGTQFTVSSQEFSQKVFTLLFGEHNVMNCLAAMAACVYGLGISVEQAASSILTFPGIPGRMEKIDLGQPFIAVVDFAHTPNALLSTIKMARTLTERKVITVFGSAGERDHQKRRMMADISVKYADVTILTAEDPRHESLDAILKEMAEGAISGGGVINRSVFQIPNRAEAINKAVQLAGEGDIVLVCGKGHEQSMCFGDVEYPWDDRIALKAALSEQLGIKGPEMPSLPDEGKIIITNSF